MRPRSILLTSLVALWSATAIAQPAPNAAPAAPAAAATDDADQLFRDANKLYNDKKYVEAEATYEKAFAKKQSHDIAANLGYAEMKQNKMVEAAEHITFAVRAWPPTGKEENRKSAEEQLNKIKAELCVLTIEVNVPDAKVLVNDQEPQPGARLAERFALPGRITIRAQRQGYQDAESVIEAAAKGSSHAVKLTLAPVPEAVPTSTSSADVTSTSTSVPHPPPTSDHPRREVVMGGAALSGVAIVVGAVLLGVAEKTRMDLRAETPKNPDGSLVCARDPSPETALPECDEIRARARTGTAIGQAGIGLLVTGGLVGLATVGYALVWPKLQKQPATAVIPVISPTHAGLVWSGSF